MLNSIKKLMYLSECIKMVVTPLVISNGYYCLKLALLDSAHMHIELSHHACMPKLNIHQRVSIYLNNFNYYILTSSKLSSKCTLPNSSCSCFTISIFSIPLIILIRMRFLVMFGPCCPSSKIVSLVKVTSINGFPLGQ